MPSITGQFLELSEQSFNEPHHFTDRFVGGVQQFEIDPLTGINTGLSARDILSNLAVTHGWPLLGIFVSQVGQGEMKHYILHRSDFPSQTGAPDQRADKLQTEIDESFQTVFHLSKEVTDPEDDDFGETDEFDPFFANTHFWNYRSDNLYESKIPGGAGDYLVRIDGRENGNPPANWWVEFN